MVWKGWLPCLQRNCNQDGRKDRDPQSQEGASLRELEPELAPKRFNLNRGNSLTARAYRGIGRHSVIDHRSVEMALSYLQEHHMP